MPSTVDAARTDESIAQEVVAVRRAEEKLADVEAAEAKHLADAALLLGGQAQAFAFIETFGRVAAIAKLKQVKETGAYKQHHGTWEAFCSSLGFTRRKIDIDIQNLETLGADFLAASDRLGLGYRDLAALRALPEDARLQITDGRVVNLEEASKQEIRLLVEDLAARHSTEKRRLVDESAETARKLARVEGDLRTETAQNDQLKTRVRTLETGLGETEQEALKRLASIRTQITGAVNLIRATDPGLGTVIGAEVQGVLAYVGDLARLAALEVGRSFDDGTSPAEVEAAQAEFDQLWGESGGGETN